MNAAEDFRMREEARIEARMALVPTYKVRGSTPINHAAVCTAFGCNWVYGTEQDRDVDECTRAGEGHEDTQNHEGKVRVVPWKGVA